MEPQSGKLLITLGMMELLSRRVGKIAFFRPIIDESNGQDNDINLIRSKYCPDMSYDECYGFEAEEVKKIAAKGNLNEFYVSILAKFKALEKKYDFVLCEALTVPDFLLHLISRLTLKLLKILAVHF
jgi:phosphate acetyltransferase